MTRTIASQQSRLRTVADLQAQVRMLQDQLAKSQRLAAVGTMTAMVAHEFNNILTPIINYARMARKNPALTGKAVDRAADDGQRAIDICKAILGIARNEHGEPTDIDLRQLIDQTLTAMARRPEKDGIELVLDIEPAMMFRGMRVELQQVLLNLLINAKAAVLDKRGQRRIEVAARRHGDEVEITVKDNGVGIAPENMQRIWEPFFSTKDGSDESQGFGLGLTICRELTTSMGGTIEVQSTPGEGTEFAIRIPALPSPVARSA